MSCATGHVEHLSQERTRVRKDPLSAAAAGAFLMGFVLLLSDAAGFMFGRQGPFDLRSEEEHWSLGDGTEVSSRSEVLTFRGDDVFTVRSYDGDLSTAGVAEPRASAARPLRTW